MKVYTHDRDLLFSIQYYKLTCYVQVNKNYGRISVDEFFKLLARCLDADGKVIYNISVDKLIKHAAGLTVYIT